MTLNKNIYQLTKATIVFASLMLLISFILTPLSAAQPSFTEVTPTGDTLFVTDDATDFWVNAVAPADADGDGDLDLAVLGFYVVYYESSEDLLVLFRNQGPDSSGNWVFTEELVPLGSVSAGASDLAWGDYDGDGDPDLVVGSDGATVLYRNDSGVLTAMDTLLPGYYEDSGYTGAYDLRSITWADADNDGDLDLLVPSVFDFENFTYSTKLLRNDGSDGGNGWLFTDLDASLDSTAHAQSAWADHDADDDLDLFLVNVDPYSEAGFIRRFRNDNGIFAGEDLLGIRVEYGLADWADYDSDGDLDILVAGNIQETDTTYNTVLRIYRNDSGAYTETTLIDAPNADWLDLHAATWADYDSDGDVDLLITGNFVGATEIEGRSEVYGNEAGVFTALGVELPAPVSSVGRGGAFTWLDIDNDGDLDYLVAGAYYVPGGNGLVEARMHLYQNGAPEVNNPPAAPTGLTAAVDGDQVTLAWNPPSDDHTPSQALTYDLEMLLSGEITATAKRLPEPGNISAVTSWSLRGLQPGTYTWSVSAVDSAYNGSAKAEGTFTIAPAPDELSVKMTPVNPPIIVPAGGGSFQYNVEIVNNSNLLQTFNFWVVVHAPNGTSRFATRFSGTLGPGGIFARTIMQRVPAFLPPGTYVQTGMLSTSPGMVNASDHFIWRKLPRVTGQ